MSLKFSHHPEDEQLEEYSNSTLAEDTVPQLEEHLLVCSVCQNRLRESDDYIRAMRSAASAWPKTETKRRFFGDPAWIFNLGRKPVLALGVVLIACVSVVVMSRIGSHLNSQQQPVAVMLTAMRGSETSPASVPAGRPLLLSIDVRGLPSSAAYDLEIVKVDGELVWAGTAEAARDSIRKEVPKRLDRGLYFVRVYAPSSSELLREYGLRIGTAR